MKLPDYTLTIQEPVVCAKPGRTLLLKACVVLLIVIGVPAIGVLIWAEVTGFNLNNLPWIPRIALAVAVGLAAFGIYKSVQEQKVPLTLSCYRDRLTISYDARPTLWKAEVPAQTAEIRYADVQSCIFSTRRYRLTLVTKEYQLTVSGASPRKKGGSIGFSTLGAPDVDFASLLEKRTPLKVVTKN